MAEWQGIFNTDSNNYPTEIMYTDSNNCLTEIMYSDLAFQYALKKIVGRYDEILKKMCSCCHLWHWWRDLWD